MNVQHYLPSSQFSLIVLSIAGSGALILGAQYLTRPPTEAPTVVVAQKDATETDWKAELDAIQAEIPGLPQAASAETVSTLLEAAKSSNYTDTAARSLLIKLADAGSQGMGADIPTQERLINDVTSNVPQIKTKKTYTTADISSVIDGKEAQKKYGNRVMEILGRHAGATSEATLFAISKATDNSDPKELLPLPSIQQEYELLTNELSSIEVPATLVPLHLQALNTLGVIAATFDDMKLVLTDPLRGLNGIRQYQIQLGQVGRVFISIAEILVKNGILFTKEEPGATWAAFLSTDQP